ncbi:unnamed protein product [Gadus morhua 'NCC']
MSSARCRCRRLRKHTSPPVFLLFSLAPLFTGPEASSQQHYCSVTLMAVPDLLERVLLADVTAGFPRAAARGRAARLSQRATV